MKTKICITEKEFNKARDIFTSSQFEFMPVPCDEVTVAEAILRHNCAAAVLGVELYVNELYAALPGGGLIARFGVGHDGIDKQKASAAGLFVTNTPGALDDSVAEHAVWLIGSLARNVPQHDRQFKAGMWQGSIGTELAGKVLLVIGCGRIGSKVAKIASFGFGMHVIGYDVVKMDKCKMSETGFAEIALSLDSALGKADFISLHLPSLPTTRHFVKSDLILKMKHTACLINTARGPIVDERALFDAINSNALAGAGLDVYENEPYVPVDPEKDLRKLEQVVLTPHIGSSSMQACQRMGIRVLENIKACIEKRYNDMDIVNRDILRAV